MSTTGLVIQGSLISQGRKSGKNAHIGWRNIQEEEWVQYDCRENIRQIIREFGHLFSLIVVSTWKNDIHLNESFSGANLVVSDDESLPKRYRKDKQGRIVEDNRFRQMHSSLAGIEYLEKHSEIDMAVKIRTDQYMDLEKILEFVNRAKALQNYTPEVIFVPSIMREDARYGILDFYFAGKISAMKAFLRSMFEYDAFEFESSIHREMWLKYAYAAYQKAISAPEYAYFPASYRNAYCEETLQIFQYMAHHVFWPLSFDCFKTIVWRGSPFSKEALESERRNNIFQGTVSENSIEEICGMLSARAPRFLGIDWQRYASFRRTVLRKPFSLGELFSVYCSMALQFAFRFISRFGYFLTHPAAFFAGTHRRISRFLKFDK